MKASGTFENFLCDSNPLRQLRNERGFKARGILAEPPATLSSQRFKRCFAADAATRGRIEIAGETIEVDINAGKQIHRDRISMGPNVLDRARSRDNSFRE